MAARFLGDVANSDGASLVVLKTWHRASQSKPSSLQLCFSSGQSTGAMRRSVMYIYIVSAWLCTLRLFSTILVNDRMPRLSTTMWVETPSSRNKKKSLPAWLRSESDYCSTHPDWITFVRAQLLSMRHTKFDPGLLRHNKIGGPHGFKNWFAGEMWIHQCSCIPYRSLGWTM